MVIPNTKILFTFVALITLAVLLVLGLGNTGSIQIKLQENKYVVSEPQTGTFTLEGIKGTYETSWLGELNSDDGVILSNNQDGDLTIENKIESGNPVKLYSRITSIGGNMFGTETNFVEAKIRLPPGKVNVDYAYDMTSYGDNVKVYIKAENFAKTFYVKGKGSHLSDIEQYSFDLDYEKEVTFRIETTLSSKQENAEGSMVITFEPEQNETSSPIGNEEQEPVTKLSFTERFNNWIQSLINKFFNWRPELI